MPKYKSNLVETKYSRFGINTTNNTRHCSTVTWKLHPESIGLN